MENGFNRLVSLGGADYPDRMEGIYHFGSYDGKPDVIALKIKIPRSDPALPSIVKLIPGANWHERETYDLFGIKFEGHPDLTRIFYRPIFRFSFAQRLAWRRYGASFVWRRLGEAPTNLIEQRKI